MAASSPAIMKFKDGLPSKKQFGERLRLLISQGAENNTCYCLLGDKITIGRDEAADIRLDDGKTSREHAVLLWRKNFYEIQDLSSSNGILVNNIRTPKVNVKPGDVFIIGMTIFEVHLSPVGQNPGKVNLAKQSPEQQKLSRNKMIVYGAVLFALFLAFSASEDGVKTLRQRARVEVVDDQAGKKVLNKKELKKAMSEYLPLSGGNTSGAKKDADNFFRFGSRELDNKNYLRAINAFETALTVDPNHELSKIYLKKAKKEFQNDVDNTYLVAADAEHGLRFREACMRYQDVLRFLETDPTNKTFVKAKEALDHLVDSEKCTR